MYPLGNPGTARLVPALALIKSVRVYFGRLLLRRFQPSLVLDDFGSRLGRSWRETDEANTDRATLIRHLLESQYSSPVRIVAFNTAEGWSRDVTDEIAAELAQACVNRGEMPPSIADFIADHTRSSRVR